METIKQTIAYFGSRPKMADALGIRYDMITKFLSHDRFPSQKIAKLIEEKTNGEIKALDILIEKAKIKYEMLLEDMEDEYIVRSRLENPGKTWTLDELEK